MFLNEIKSCKTCLCDDKILLKMPVENPTSFVFRYAFIKRLSTALLLEFSPPQIMEEENEQSAKLELD